MPLYLFGKVIVEKWVSSFDMTIAVYTEKEISNTIMMDSVVCMHLFNKFRNPSMPLFFYAVLHS